MAARSRVKNRDDFPADVKDLLAKRVGMLCSNPNCRQPTSGPQEDPAKVLNIGVAAHITGAAPGGPRFDGNMSPEARCAFDNGIWLCQNCAKLVDNDARRFASDVLREWKRLSECAALLAIEEPGAVDDIRTSDSDLIRFFAQCFDRPAFQDHFRQEGSMEAFDKAIEDTITAINTGCLRSRDGAILAKGKGKAFLRNSSWRDKLDAIVDLLRAIRSRYDLALKGGQIHVSRGDGREEWYCIHDHGVAAWMDATRAEALEILGEVCNEAGVRPPRFPRAFPRLLNRPAPRDLRGGEEIRG